MRDGYVERKSGFLQLLWEVRIGRVCALTRHLDLQLRQIRRRTEGEVPKYTVVIRDRGHGKLAKLAPRTLRRRFCRAVPAGWGAQS